MILRCDRFFGTFFSKWIMNFFISLDMYQSSMVAITTVTIWEQKNEFWEQKNAVVHDEKVVFPCVLVTQNVNKLLDFLEARNLLC